MTVRDVIKFEQEEAVKNAKKELAADYIFELLKDYGEIPEKIRERIDNESDPDVLKRWLKLAARCGSMEAFEEQAGESPACFI